MLSTRIEFRGPHSSDQERTGANRFVPDPKHVSTSYRAAEPARMKGARDPVSHLDPRYPSPTGGEMPRPLRVSADPAYVEPT
jgi:hypothetical protein